MSSGRVLSPMFIIGLFVLLLNDLVLKESFPGLLTGKLSDVAGLFIFPIFLSDVFPRKKMIVYIATGVAFVLWKMPFMDDVLAIVSYSSVFHLSRIQDYTDYLALPMLPLSYLYKPTGELHKRIAYVSTRYVLGAIAIFAFAATVGPYQTLETYDLHYSKAEVYSAFREFYRRHTDYVLPTKYDTAVLRFQPLVPSADSVRFYFVVNYFGEEVIPWASFEFKQDQWNSPRCQLTLVGFITPGGLWRDGGNIPSAKKQPLIDWFGKTVMAEIDKILKEDRAKTNPQ